MKCMIFYILWFSIACVTCGKTKNEHLKKKLFLLNLPFASTVNKERNCSLARSALVRKLLLQDFNPIYERYGVDIPKNCVFNLKQSMYNSLEEKKLETSNGFWKCDACGKKFYTEEYTYKHFYKKHRDLINHGKEYRCLADYCEIFRCDLHEQYPIIRDNFPDCNNKKTRQIQRDCEKIINRCLPTNQMRHHVYDALTKSLCSELTCEHFYTQFEDMAFTTLVLLVISIPSIIFSCCAACWKLCEYLSEEDEEAYVSVSELEKRRRERLQRVRDAQSAAMKNRMGKYGHNTLVHRRYR